MTVVEDAQRATQAWIAAGCPSVYYSVVETDPPDRNPYNADVEDMETGKTEAVLREWFREWNGFSFRPRNQYSQAGEDGVLADLFRRIGVTNQCAFEFGALDGVTLSNTRSLWEEGWQTFLIEADPTAYAQIPCERGVTKERAFVTPVNVDNLLLGMDCPTEPDFGVIDVDGQEYHIWQGMERVRPRVVMVEVSPKVAEYASVVEKGAYSGQSGYLPVKALAEAKGYRVVARNWINAICVREDVLRG